MPEATQPSHLPPKRKASPQFTWEDFATASLPVLACFLGGATTKWAEGGVLLVLGLMLMVNPPRFSLGWKMHFLLFALVACAGMAFLPANWFFQPAWRLALTNDFGIELPGTVSPQPWMTFGALLSFLAGLCWFYYVSGQEVEVRAARRQLRIFALGVILLAGLAVALYWQHTALPFWHNSRGFGPFPNRNQTANLFGLASLVILACGHDEIRRHKKGWIFWLAGLAVVVTALILNFSRAGLGLLLVGAVVWLVVLALRAGSAARIAVGGSALLALLTTLLIFGGQTLERFNLRGTGSGIASDFRWLVFQDAFELIRSSPWTGLGLGNFEPVFAIFRDASIGQSRALHPESDWLWLAAEMGWPAVALVLVGLALLARRVFPFVEGTNQWFRLAAFVGGLLFALHGLVDVAGHRVGSAYAGIFLFALALRRPLRQPAGYGLLYFFRFAGSLLVALGLTWVVATYRAMPLPGPIGVGVERHLATTSNVGRQFNDTIMHANRGLKWAPLDWQLYFLRALGKVGAQRPDAEALADFRRARFLEPNSFEVPYQEGVAWITRRPVLAVTAWREALRRAGPERSKLYARMLSNAEQFSPEVRSMLEDFGGGQHDLALAFLERAQGADFTAAVNRLLRRDPELAAFTSDERERFFLLWSERGDLEALDAYLAARPHLLTAGWRGLAKQRASKGDFRDAYELTRRFGARPALPQFAEDGSTIEQLEKALFSDPNDYRSAFMLYDRQRAAGQLDDALNTLRRLTGVRTAPPYFHFLEAEAWAAKENWERAWKAWESFDRDSGK